MYCVSGSMVDIEDSTVSKIDVQGTQNLIWEPGRITWWGGSQDGRGGGSQRLEETM